MADNPVVRAAIEIIDSKKYTYDKEGFRGAGWLSDSKMDCSEFVLQSFRRAGYSKFPVLSSHMMAHRFSGISDGEAKAGDIVYWSTGHVGVIVDPGLGTFAGAQSSGLAIANYKYGFWAVRGVKKFLRYCE
jgi:cell wall-associated NlpC family hydrolase